MTKPFAIPKQLVWEAFQRVKANGGAGGVDEESIEDVREEARRQPVQALESHGIRQLLPAAGQSRADPEEDRGHAHPGRADGDFITHSSQLSIAMTVLEMSRVADSIAVDRGAAASLTVIHHGPWPSIWRALITPCLIQ